MAQERQINKWEVKKTALIGGGVGIFGGFFSFYAAAAVATEVAAVHQISERLTVIHFTTDWSTLWAVFTPVTLGIFWGASIISLLWTHFIDDTAWNEEARQHLLRLCDDIIVHILEPLRLKGLLEERGGKIRIKEEALERPENKNLKILVDCLRDAEKELDNADIFLVRPSQQVASACFVVFGIGFAVALAVFSGPIGAAIVGAIVLAFCARYAWEKHKIETSDTYLHRANDILNKLDDGNGISKLDDGNDKRFVDSCSYLRKQAATALAKRPSFWEDFYKPERPINKKKTDVELVSYSMVSG